MAKGDITARVPFSSPYGANGSTSISFGDYSTVSPTPGIAFKAYLNEPQDFSGGTLRWIQVGTKSDGSNSGWFNSWQYSKGHGLDTSYPFGERYVRGPISDVPKSTTADAPALLNGGTEGFYDLGVTMYLVYHPKGNGDWVPLQSVKWSWHAKFKNGDSLFIVDAPSSGTDQRTYPEWSTYFSVNHDS